MGRTEEGQCSCWSVNGRSGCRHSRCRLTGSSQPGVLGNTIATSNSSAERASLEAQIDELRKKVGRSYSGTVKVYNWSEYIADGLLKTFKDEYGVDVVYDTFESMDEARSKIFVGNSGYDVVVFSDYVILDAIAGGFVQELDYANIPNAKHADTRLMKSWRTCRLNALSALTRRLSGTGSTRR